MQDRSNLANATVFLCFWMMTMDIAILVLFSLTSDSETVWHSEPSSRASKPPEWMETTIQKIRIGSGSPEWRSDEC
uniref:Uncharacterized protein n=1 Tax=Daphnia galeata TaxID=27404 RepID=A0A8J2S120_9CRUS|nr:unnamed protein product [Daphnia galeata]